MARVFLAEDLRHRRQVAIKVLRPEIASAVAHERFLREIQISAQLSHPHIVPLLESGEAEGMVYFVMPYIEGESLQARLAREGRLAVSDAARILRDVADAVAYAHSRGVVHRDIKPDNVILIGRHAVVTDFGVARALREATGLQQLTGSGIAIGTPAYMAPEQASGLEVDHRTDIYALGALGYELLTGRTVFEGRSAQDVLAKHVTQKPEPVTAHRPDVPPALAELVMRCLAKRPDDRWDSADVLVGQLEVLATPSGGIASTALRATLFATRTPARRVLTGTLGIGGIAAVVVLVRGLAGRPEPATPLHRQLTFTGDVTFASISPDGRTLAYVTGTVQRGGKLMLQDLQGGATLELASIEPQGWQLVEWRADGSQLLFRGCYPHPRNCGTFVISPLGGSPQALGFFGGRQPMWSPDGGRIVGSTYGARQLWIHDLSSEERRAVPVSGSFHVLMGVDWSPTGDMLAFTTRDSLGRAGLHAIRTDGTEQRTLLDEPGYADFLRWSSRANAIYYLQGGLPDYQLAAELRKLRVSREGRRARRGPETVLTGLRVSPLLADLAAFSLTADAKRLVYTRFEVRANLWRLTPTKTAEGWSLSLQQLTTGTAVRMFPSVSPDGRWIAFLEMGATGADIWKIPIEGGAPTRLTFLGTVAGQPAWSPDGAKIAFGARSGGKVNVAIVRSVGGSPEVFPRTGLGEGGHLSWAPGARIAYQLAGNRGIHLLDPDTGNEEPFVPRDAEPWTFYPRYSPDGRLLALWENRSSPEAGVWIRSLADGTGRLLVGGFWRPLGWSEDGTGVFVARTGTGDVRLLSVADGSAQLVARLPFDALEIDRAGCDVYWQSHQWRLICSREERSADAWMIENFDPAVR
jgi:Tol biopolymer transport system component